jgi:hypothetical protein
VDRLAKKVETVSPDQFTDRDERTAFLTRYQTRSGTNSAASGAS